MFAAMTETRFVVPSASAATFSGSRIPSGSGLILVIFRVPSRSIASRVWRTAWCSNADVTTRPAPYLAARIAQLSASVPPDVK